MRVQKIISLAKVLESLKHFADMVVVKHSLFSLPFFLTSLFMSSYLHSNHLWFGFPLLLLGLLALMAARNFAMAANRLLDAKIDAKNPRTANRHIPAQLLGFKTSIVFTIVNAAVFILCAYLINHLAFILSPIVLLILGSYSLFKRFSQSAHMILGFCLGLSTLCADIMVSGSIHVHSSLLCFAVSFWCAGFDILYALQDMEFDKEQGLFSIPALYGKEASIFISALCQAVALIFLFLYFFEVEAGIWAFLAVIICALILCAEQVLIRLNYASLNVVFFNLNSSLGIVFMIGFIIDLWIRHAL